MRNKSIGGSRGTDQEEQIKRNGPRGTDQEEWIKMNGSRGTDQEEWVKRNRPSGTDKDERIKKYESRGTEQEKWIMSTKSRAGSRGTNQELDQEEQIKRWIKRNMYWELSKLKILKCNRTHCEWLPGKRIYSTERRTEKNFCLFSYSSSSSFIVHPMLDQVRPGHIESSRSIRYL